MGFGLAIWVVREVRTGVAHLKIASVLRSQDSQWFWIFIAIHALFVGLLFWGAFKEWRQGQRDPNF